MRSIAAALLCSALAACSASGLDDELAGDDPDLESTGKADGVGTYTYFEISRDMRRCAAPLCGGYFVSRVNRSTTRCADGRYHDVCYAFTLDTSALGLSAEQRDELEGGITTGRALVRGRTRMFDDGAPFGRQPQFVATEAWLAPWSDVTADGVYARIEDAHIQCITTPCPSLNELKLNGSSKASLSELDWSASGLATDADQESGSQAIFGGPGLIVAGSRGHVTGMGGTGKTRTITKYWLKMEPKQNDCVVTGCSGQVCAEEPMFTTCEYRPEYACYQTATCERQPGGECGWTETDELLQCLEGSL